MYCYNCGKEIAETVKFCPYCGADIVVDRLCPNCGTKLPSAPNIKFCPACRTPLNNI